MSIYELAFAKITIRQEDIAEVIINEGIEMNQAMVSEYHDFLLKYLKAPFSLLINKKNSYTYDFYAQLNIATLKEINAMAVVSYTRAAKISTDVLHDMHSKEWDLKSFTNEKEALSWLRLKQQEI